MKKTSFSMTIMALVMTGLFLSNIMPVSAAKVVTKSTPYGTLRGEIAPGINNEIYSGKICTGLTKIDNKVSRIICSIVAKRTSNGKHLGNDIFSNTNATSVGGVFELGGHQDITVTFYGTHEVRHTNGYVVYTLSKG